MLAFRLIAVLAAVAAPGLRAGAAPLLLAEARAMTPEALADALLAPGHPPVVKAMVNPFGMEAPARSLSRVDLVTRAQPAEEPDFCVATSLKVAFAPTTAGVDTMFNPVPMRASRIVAGQTYGYVGPRASAADCAPRRVLFEVTSDTKGRQLALVRALASAQAMARKGRRPAFDILYENQDPKAFSTFATPLLALASLPLEGVLQVSPKHLVTTTTSGVPDSAVTTSEDARVEIQTWTAILSEDRDGITRVTLLQHLPIVF